MIFDLYVFFAHCLNCSYRDNDCSFFYANYIYKKACCEFQEEDCIYQKACCIYREEDCEFQEEDCIYREEDCVYQEACCIYREKNCIYQEACCIYQEEDYVYQEACTVKNKAIKNRRIFYQTPVNIYIGLITKKRRSIQIAFLSYYFVFLFCFSWPCVGSERICR